VGNQVYAPANPMSFQRVWIMPPSRVGAQECAQQR
jgi:hypothetical protein